MPALPGVGPVWPLDAIDRRTAVRPLEFVEIEAEPAEVPVEPLVLTAPPPGETRWSLWGDAEA